MHPARPSSSIPITSTQFASTITTLSTIQDTSWYMDSEATNHITFGPLSWSTHLLQGPD